MHFTLLINALAASVLASPLATTPITQTGKIDTWKSAPGTVSYCEVGDGQKNLVKFGRDNPVETVIHNACVAMMPECAFRDQLSDDISCTATVDFQLESDKTYGPPNVVALRSNVLVSPPYREDRHTFWTVQDCYGYFHQLLEKTNPEGCCTSDGLLLGQLHVGEGSPLAGAKFYITDRVFNYEN
ncbi:hypothetical protein COCMIDRAFT_38435 [Bipolaris oryzae ATCC 44560]|uniref:Ecp2 effector protein domain-containing protein n=1 Tax=Bipolaris oryzae ATCC 44560 TaxID=930090 RepID=W6YW64_COCMI|nr:uncharacterized protein COCMIDRAFT_38435 [Bipolaris oryzae ATCC 44560]EUC43632.1 hypothetical protein COCMIDRAFT_38435 [Bipolaris oryzae ATCC 44560]